MDDRKSLDSVILNILGLSEYFEDIYKAVVDLVLTRQRKARSLKK